MHDCFECAVDAVLTSSGGVVWDENAFDQLMLSVRSELSDRLERIGQDAAAALNSLHAVNMAIAETPDVFADVLDDVERQLDHFIFPGFLTAVGADRVDDIRRYLDAAEYRLRRLSENPDRDRGRMALVCGLEDEHDRLAEVLSWSPELVDLVWMLQEFRVSLFAQSVGVNGSVSEKKIRAALQDLLT
jgi:ATP-dependent helicase HrpA